jgi:hypothetical protein
MKKIALLCMMEQIMVHVPTDPFLLVEVSVAPYVFFFMSDIQQSTGLPHPFFAMLISSHLTSEDDPRTLNGYCIPACRLLSNFGKTENNDEAKIISLALKAFLDMRFIQITFKVALVLINAPTLSSLYRRSSADSPLFLFNSLSGLRTPARFWSSLICPVLQF